MSLLLVVTTQNVVIPRNEQKIYFSRNLYKNFYTQYATRKKYSSYVFLQITKVYKNRANELSFALVVIFWCIYLRRVDSCTAQKTEVVLPTEED